MLDVNYFTRKPIHRLVDYVYEAERKHLLETVDEDLYWEERPDEDPTKWSDQELYEYCVDHDVDHIWVDCYMVKQLLVEDDDKEHPFTFDH